MPLVSGLRLCIVQNPPFLILLVAITIINSQPYSIYFVPYWTQFCAQASDGWQSILLLVYIGSYFATIPLWVLLAKALGKKRAYVANLALGILGMLLFMIPSSGNMLLSTLAAVGAGFSGIYLTSSNFLFVAIQADVVELDELYSGFRREGQYNNLVQELLTLTSFFSVNLPLFALQLVGFDEQSPTQTERVQLWIRLLLGPISAAISLIGLVFLLFYPLDEKLHKMVVAAIETHKKNLPALDPLSKKTILPPNLVSPSGRQSFEASSSSFSSSSSSSSSPSSINASSRGDDLREEAEATPDDDSAEGERLIRSRRLEEDDEQFLRARWDLASFAHYEIREIKRWGSWFALLIPLRSNLCWSLLLVLALLLWIFLPLYSQVATFLLTVGLGMLGYHFMRLLSAFRIFRTRPSRKILEFYLSNPQFVSRKE